MKFKVVSIAILLVLLATISYLLKDNKELKQDVTRWRDNYNTVEDTAAKLQKQVQDIKEISIEREEIWRLENATLTRQNNILRKDNSRLKGLVSLQMEIRDTLYSKDSVPCEGSISFISEWMNATVHISNTSSLEYFVTAPIHIIRYVKKVPVNPRKFQLWANEHTLTRWLIKKKEEDRLKVWSDNPRLTTSVKSYNVKE